MKRILTFIILMISCMTTFSQNTIFSPSLEESLTTPDHEEVEKKLIQQTLSMKPTESRTYYSGFCALKSNYGNTMDALWDKTIKVDVWSNGVIRINNKEYYKIKKSLNNAYYQIGDGPFSCFKIQFPYYPNRDEINLISFGKDDDYLYIENYSKTYKRLPKSQTGTAQNYGSGSYDKNNSSSYHNKDKVCSSCGGTGVSKTPNTGGSLTSWVAYYNSQGNKCPYCGGHTKHLHDRCPSCNVPSY